MVKNRKASLSNNKASIAFDFKRDCKLMNKNEKRLSETA